MKLVNLAILGVLLPVPGPPTESQDPNGSILVAGFCEAFRYLGDWASRLQVLYRILAAEVHLIDGIKHILGCGLSDAVHERIRNRIHVYTQK